MTAISKAKSAKVKLFAWTQKTARWNFAKNICQKRGIRALIPSFSKRETQNHDPVQRSGVRQH